MSFPSQLRLLLPILILLLVARAIPAQTQQEEEQQQQQQQGDKQLRLLGSDQVSGESQQVSAVVSADLDAAATGQITFLSAFFMMLITILIFRIKRTLVKIIMMKVIPLYRLSCRF